MVHACINSACVLAPALAELMSISKQQMETHCSYLANQQFSATADLYNFTVMMDKART